MKILALTICIRLVPASLTKIVLKLLEWGNYLNQSRIKSGISEL